MLFNHDEQAAWVVFQSEDIDPRNQENSIIGMDCPECGLPLEEGHECAEDEEFGTPNASYCNSSEQDHNGGWFCFHPDCVTITEEL